MNKVIGVIVFFIALFLFPQNQVQAGFFDWLMGDNQNLILTGTLSEDGMSYSNNHFWDNIFRTKDGEAEPVFQVIRTHSVRATGYSSTPDQTDDTPFLTASGTYVRDGVIAANFYIDGKRVPFGTMIRIPEIYGEKIFVVEDRMNSRYKNNIDIWFPERDTALSFGNKKVNIEIIVPTDES